MFGRTLYSTKFFAHLRESSGRSANALVPIVLELHPARSMIDVGCGTAGWVKAFADRGVAAAGIDGDYVRRDQLLIDHERFAAYDLNRQLDIAGLCRRFGRNERFDLATCLEVAEHLAPERSDGLVRDLCGLADVVLFAAAIPFQGGAGHVNERWQAWWAQRFVDNGYDPFDVLRRAIWGRRDIAWWYKQNTILYVRRGSAAHARFSERHGVPTSAAFDLVHPEMLRGKVARLKHHNVIQKIVNRFRHSAGQPRAGLYETPLHGDESWRGEEPSQTNRYDETSR
jgi:SAM-dependent methyltransferase